jgi:hypothetical protein
LFIGSAVHLFELLLFLCIDASDRIATKNHSGSGGPHSTALLNMQDRQQVMQFLEKKKLEDLFSCKQEYQHLSQ